MNHFRSALVSPFAAAVLAAGLAGCGAETGQESPHPRNGPETTDPTLEPVGELIASWSQGQAGQGWVTEIDRSPVLLLTADDRDHWIAEAPTEAAELTALGEIDLNEHSLVIGRYPRCDEVSAVYVEDTGDERPLLRFAVESDHQVVCAWSPETIDVWAVSRDETGGQAPRVVTSSPPARPGETAPVGSLVHTLDESHASAEDLAEIVTEHGGLLSETDRRDALADALEAVLEAGDTRPETIRALDLDESHLVVTSYRKCTEASAVFADTTRDPTLVWVEIVGGDPDLLCSWSPLTIDVWQVSHDEVPGRVELGQYRPFWDL